MTPQIPDSESPIASEPLDSAWDECVDELIEAAQEGPIERLRAALKIVPANTQSPSGRTALMMALAYRRREEALFLAPMSDLSLRDAEGNTPLILAAYAGFVEGLLSVMHGCDLNARDSDGATALMWAAVNDAPECVELLLADARCDPFLALSDVFFDMPDGGILHSALADFGRELNAANFSVPETGMSAFWLAAQCSQWRCADMLSPYAEAALLDKVMQFAGREHFPRTLAREEAKALQATVDSAHAAACVSGAISLISQRAAPRI